MALVIVSKPWTVCLDGGGSKTAVQVLDQSGTTVELEYKHTFANRVEVGGTNLNSNDPGKVKEAFNQMFYHVKIKGRPLHEIASDCTVLAGIAGLGAVKNKETIGQLLRENGVADDSQELLTDAEMSMRLFTGDGAILISGTGSICMGRRGGLPYRVEGLGPLFGDPGSGYAMGLAAIRAALAEVYGFGEPTKLTDAICGYFQENDLKKLVPLLNNRTITAAQIAGVAKIVIGMKETDIIAAEILAKAKNDLAQLLATMVKISDLRECQIHLWGGIFKSSCAQEIVAFLMKEPSMEGRGITLVNQAHENVAWLYGKRLRATVSAENTTLLV